MRKKIIVLMILITFCVSILSIFCNVEAFSGELDPKNYITMPLSIMLSNGVGSGTIRVSSSASSYSISYQKVDMSESKYQEISNKGTEIDNYYNESKKTLDEKEAKANPLYQEYNTLQKSGTATEEQLTEAYNKAKEASNEYNEYVNTVNANLKKMNQEYYALIPNYTNSWTPTTNTTDNVQLDFKNYSGKIYFVLWAKIDNGTDVYYDMTIYSSKVDRNETISISKTSASIKINETLQLTASSSTSSKITWTSSDTSIATVDSNGLVKGIKEGYAVITAKGSEKTATCTITVDQNGEWTDFTNAKFELKKVGTSSCNLEISNVIPKTNSLYYLLITSNADKPKITSDTEKKKISLTYDSNNKKFYSHELEEYVELNQDLYASVIEENKDKEVVIYGKKINRYSEPKYNDAFLATFMTNKKDQIITKFTYSGKADRNVQIKIGRVTDLSIIKKIKNGDNSGFESLLSLAKSNDGIFNKNVEIKKDSKSDVSYDANKDSNEADLIKLDNLQDGAYYFLYVKVDDENGKYITQEAVTLAQGQTYPGGWSMFFYGDNNLKWPDYENTKQEDDSTAKGELPQTGVQATVIISLIVIFTGVGVFSYRQYKKNSF